MPLNPFLPRYLFQPLRIFAFKLGALAHPQNISIQAFSFSGYLHVGCTVKIDRQGRWQNPSPAFQLTSSLARDLRQGIIACTTPSVRFSTPDIFREVSPVQFQARDMRVSAAMEHWRSVSVWREPQCLAISATPWSLISSHQEISNVMIWRNQIKSDQIKSGRIRRLEEFATRNGEKQQVKRGN